MLENRDAFRIADARARETLNVTCFIGFVKRFASFKNLNKKSPMEYINEIAPIPVEGRVVACDGGHDILGHPVEYISLDSEEPNVCKYCGLRYVQAHHKHH
ncbi:hypothetical protein L7F22_017523 [Adiantum nelumboides]|nr:hypothetical protein [Adiantum nelumboides]